MRNHFNCTVLIVLLVISIWIKLSVSYENCTADEFTCADGSCIQIEQRCDNVMNCDSGNDEVDCKGFLCSRNKWHLCGDKQCVEDSLKCNGEFDCIDLSDERNCDNLPRASSCPQNQFLCHNEDICIPNLWVCNGVKECLNGEDESESECEKKPCYNDHRCGSGECVYTSWVCDGVYDCRDGSDEHNCDNKTIPQRCTADRGLVLCADEKHCIPQQDVCNGVIDCPDKSDEILCPFNCNEKECPQSRNCINTTSTGNTTWCTCPSGFRLVNGVVCEDVDECSQYGNCDQMCKNTNGSYYCSCTDGYTLGADNIACELTIGTPTLYFADGVSLKKIYTKSYTTVVLLDRLVNAVAFTSDGNLLYFTETVDDNIRINRANNSNSSDVIPFITIGIKTPEFISVDPLTGNVYFTDGALKHIGVCSSDGIYCKILITCENDQPRGFTLHFTNGEMFWTEWGPNPRIARAYMDSTDETNFITHDLIHPTGVAIDSHNSIQRLFWADSGRRLIETVKLDGTDRRVIYKATLMHPYSITVFENRIYWSDLITRTIEGCDKLNGQNHTLYVKYLHDTVYTVEAYHWHLHENLPMLCQQNDCTELCLRKHNNVSCACSEGRDLDLTQSGCTGSEIGSQRFLIGSLNEFWTIEFKMLGNLTIQGVVHLDTIAAIAFNIKDESAFVANNAMKSILKLNVNTGSTELILTEESIEHITSLDFDYLGNSIYWCDSEKRTIELYNLETKTTKVIFKFTPGEKPISIALVPEHGLLFCTVQKFKNISEILLMDMDGLNKIKIVKEGLIGPVHLTFDPLLESIFWADYGTGNIESYNVNSKDRKEYKSLQTFVIGITTLKSDVFWVKNNSNQLFWANKINSLDNTNVKTYSIDPFNNYYRQIAHFISIAPRSPPYHPCQHNNGNCSHFCIPGAAMSAKCSCPLGLKLDSDNRNCFKPKCTILQFHCDRSDMCIPKKDRCNNLKDCLYGEDELGCPASIYCPDEYFKCLNGDCINKTLVCDLNFDCHDKSDEIHCDYIYQSCTIKEFMCHNKMCIPSTKLCDKVIHCPNYEDLEYCYTCPPEEFKCSIGNCIQKSWECDGEIDCRDGSDEHDKCAYKNCTLPNFLCDNGLCINGTLRCNKLDDCGDFSDEVHCKVKEKSSFCKENEFACYKNNSLCLPIQVRCNGTIECPNATDEERCGTCSFGDFRCWNGQCIHSSFMCNNYQDCDDKSDEDISICSSLSKKKNYPAIRCENKFNCEDGQCVDYNLVCDGEANCKVGSDENGYCSISCENSNCSQLCDRRPTGPICSCREGFELASDNQTCLQFNECLQEPPVCAQKCSDTMGGYACACFDRFDLTADDTSCKSKGGHPETLVFLAYNMIYTLTHTSKLESELLTNSSYKISDFDISISSHYIYYSSEDERSIHKINLGTKKHWVMNVTGLPQLISIDWITENVYYVNESISSRSISVCNFDLKICYVIYSIRDHRIITALKVDAINKLLFFATVLMESPTKSTVYKCFLDGSYVEELHMSDSDYINGIAFDYNKNLLYLTEKNDGKIFKITYDGKNQTTILENVPKAKDVTVFEDRLFFLISTHVIRICPLYVRYYACTNFSLSPGEVSHFAINKSTVQPLMYNPCKDKTCKSLCLPSKGIVKCLCETSKLEKCIHNSVSSPSEEPIDLGDQRNDNSSAWYVLIVILFILFGLIGIAIWKVGLQRTREIFGRLCSLCFRQCSNLINIVLLYTYCNSEDSRQEVE